MSHLRNRLAVLAGKSILTILRLLKRKGTTLPGAVALYVAPDLLAWFGQKLQGRVLLITGTNGKTTTANLLTSFLKMEGYEVIHNTLGANLITGITTSLLNGYDASCEQVAVLEVDEATMRRVVPKLSPSTVIVTNFFRDQMDRYGEVNHVMELVAEAIAAGDPSMKLVLNADDPLVAALGSRHQSVIWYGIENSAISSDDAEDVRDGRFCLECGNPLVYHEVRYGGLGRYECSQCDFRRPEPDVPIEHVAAGEECIGFQIWGLQGTLASKALYNVYNAAAAIIGASVLGVSSQTLEQGMQSMETGLGRMETFHLEGRRVVLTLVKNPTGFNQALRVVETEQEAFVQFILNDAYADGTDVSWIWDTNLERLVKGGTLKGVIASGTRPYDMAVRLKYAGWTQDIEVLPGDVEAVKTAISIPAVMPVYILSTYTSLYKVRDFLLAERGGGVLVEV